ncbi:unnamed protein product [Cylindrotheca closterium]|uniref:Uncharacterized protein n=1 Tax=Cylindrotheca closterium TaxID=2856 RepID=A0AAD2CQT4_9STRA|nr:unnamed protein product [Cylindrotheca closterium]
MNVLFLFFALCLVSVSIASSPHLLLSVKKNRAFFRLKRANPFVRRSNFNGSAQRWSEMIYTTRGGSSLGLTTNEGGVLCDLPDQVDEAAIQLLVDEIIRDKDTNIHLLPDSIESRLYRNTVRLTLNAIYNVLKSTHGTEFMLGHKFRLRHYPVTLGKTEAFRRVAKCNHVNVKVLEKVADRLLKNKNINQPLIPDVLERQIYINCLKVVMRILDILQGSLRINLCGHSIGLFLENSTMPVSMPPVTSMERASSVISKITREDLIRYQHEAGVMEPHGGWLSFLGKGKRAMVNQVHATMFGLVVQIVQDMLDQSTIELVGVGEIVMDLVPASHPDMAQTRPTSQLHHSRLSAKKQLSTFVSGMGIGAVLVVLLLKLLESPDGTINIGHCIRNLRNAVSNLWTRLRSFILGLVGRK